MTKLQVMSLTAICESAITQFAMVTTVNFTQSKSRAQKNLRFVRSTLSKSVRSRKKDVFVGTKLPVKLPVVINILQFLYGLSNQDIACN